MTTRQREWQIRQSNKGLCQLCNEPNVDGYRCQHHLELARISARNYQRKKNGIPLDKPLDEKDGGRPRKY